MKRTFLLIVSVTLLLSLCACGGQEAAKEPEPSALAESLLKGNVFSVSLDELPASKAASFYELNASDVAEALLYHAAGTSKEQIVILKAADETSAGNVVTSLKNLVARWIEADRDYAPQEVPKLEKAVLRQSGAWVVLVIANDPDTAAKIVGEYI